MSDIVERLFELWTRVSDVDSVTLRDAEDEIKKLRAALAFYAEKNSWRHTISLGHPQIDGTTSAALKDSGNIARAALGEKE